jgi:hypothetical protein
MVSACCSSVIAGDPKQTINKLHDVLMPGSSGGVSPRLHSRSGCQRANTHGARHPRIAIELPQADLVIVDEAHHTPANTYRKVLAAYPDAIVLGLTATPCRKDGRGLGNIFEVLIECPQVAELIDGKYRSLNRLCADHARSGVFGRRRAIMLNQLERMDRAGWSTSWFIGIGRRRR